MRPKCAWDRRANGCEPARHEGYVHADSYDQVLAAIRKGDAYDPDGDEVLAVRDDSGDYKYHYKQSQHTNPEVHESNTAEISDFLVPRDEVTQEELDEVLRSLGLAKEPDDAERRGYERGVAEVVAQVKAEIERQWKGRKRPEGALIDAGALLAAIERQVK